MLISEQPPDINHSHTITIISLIIIFIFHTQLWRDREISKDHSLRKPDKILNYIPTIRPRNRSSRARRSIHGNWRSTRSIDFTFVDSARLSSTAIDSIDFIDSIVNSLGLLHVAWPEWCALFVVYMSWLFYMYYSSACFWVLHSTFSITVYCRLLEAGRYWPAT